jgi:hypothetical protein
MARGYVRRFHRQSSIQEKAEADKAVAENTWVRRPAGGILGNKVVDHPRSKGGFGVDQGERDVEPVGNVSGPVLGLRRTTTVYAGVSVVRRAGMGP